MNRCKYSTKIGGILYDHGKMGIYYPDMEMANEFWNWVRYPVPAVNHYNFYKKTSLHVIQLEIKKTTYGKWYTDVRDDF